MSEDSKTEKNPVAIKLRKTQISFALYSLIAGGAMGVFFREFTRAFSDGLTGEELFFASYTLSLNHGHILSTGFIIPLGLALITFFLEGKLDEKTMKKLNTRFLVYIITCILSFFLLFYKGVHYMVLAGGEYDLLEIGDMLYGGSMMIRSMLYASIHTAYGVSTLMYSIPLLKGLKK